MNCPYERDVLAGRNREHAAMCADCAAALAVAPWMTEFAKLDLRDRPLPDPSLVWMKSQILGDLKAATRATRPLAIMQLLAYVAVAAAWAGLLWWKWESIASLDFLTGIDAVSAMMYFGMLVMLTSMTVILGLHTIMQEDF